VAGLGVVDVPVVACRRGDAAVAVDVIAVVVAVVVVVWFASLVVAALRLAVRRGRRRRGCVIGAISIVDHFGFGFGRRSARSLGLLSLGVRRARRLLLPELSQFFALDV
jgi:hypothetical protein